MNIKIGAILLAKSYLAAIDRGVYATKNDILLVTRVVNQHEVILITPKGSMISENISYLDKKTTLL